MYPFDNIDDYQFAVDLAKQKNPDIDYQQASRATSGWNEAEVQIRDPYNNLLCSFESAQYLGYRARQGRINAQASSRSLQPAVATADRGTKHIPSAARSARNMVEFIKGLSYLFSGIVLLIGLLLAIQIGTIGGAIGFVVFILALALAFAIHWVVKLTYIGLEVLADISEDLRVIRLSKP